MATHGTFSAFNPEQEPWTTYTERLHYYFIANGVKTEEQKCAILLSVCGSDTYKTICSLIGGETLATAKFAELIELLQKRYDPKPSFIVQCLKFYNRTQAADELVSTYLAALHQIAEHCEYKETLNDMIRDRLVCGINHEGIQKKLLAEKNLTYEKALELALAMETAEQDTKELKSATSTSLPKDLHHTSSHPPTGQASRGKGRDSVPAPCYRCLGQHTPSTCKFHTAECYLCKKTGHIAKACRSNKDKTSHNPARSQRQTKRTHYMGEDEKSEEPVEHDSSYHLFTLQSIGQNPITTQMELNKVPIQMEVDTGATVSLINKHTFDTIAKVRGQVEDLHR